MPRCDKQVICSLPSSQKQAEAPSIFDRIDAQKFWIYCHFISLMSEDFNNDQDFIPSEDETQVRDKKRSYKPHAKFTVEEDKELLSLVDEYGDDQWMLISSMMENRNPRQCKERYFTYLSPKINKSKWTEEEDALLMKKYEQYGSRWVKISKCIPERTDAMCKNRFAVLKRRDSKQQRKMEKIKKIEESKPKGKREESTKIKLPKFMHKIDFTSEPSDTPMPLEPPELECTAFPPILNPCSLDFLIQDDDLLMADHDFFPL